MRQSPALFRWLVGSLILIAGCAGAPGSHQAALNSIDEDEIVAAAEKDSFPAANAPSR